MSRRCVLVVEDDPDIQRMLYNYLECDYDVLQALTGEYGLSLLETTPPDVILLDIKMEPMNGYQFVEEMVKRGFTHIPVLIMTAFADVQQAAVDLLKQRNSVFDLVVKPFQYLDYISTCIERAIQRAEQEQKEQEHSS